MMKSHQKKILIVILIAFIVGGGVVYTMYRHNQEVKIEKKEKAKAAYQALKAKADQEVGEAQTSLDKKQIEKATLTVKKLDSQDQQPLLDKLEIASKSAAQVESAKKVLKQAQETKSEEDIALAQKSIDELKQTSEEHSKKTLQDSLDTVKAENKKVAEEKLAKEAQQKVATEKTEASEEGTTKSENALTKENALAYVTTYLSSKGYDPASFNIGEPMFTGPAPQAVQYDLSYQEKDGTGAGMFRLRENTSKHEVDITKYVGSSLDIDDYQENVLPS